MNRNSILRHLYAFAVAICGIVAFGDTAQAEEPEVGTVPVFGAFRYDSWIEFQNLNLFCSPVLGWDNPVTRHGWVEVNLAQLEQMQKPVPAETVIPQSEIQIAETEASDEQPKELFDQEIQVGQGSPVREISPVLVGMGSELPREPEPVQEPMPTQLVESEAPQELFAAESIVSESIAGEAIQAQEIAARDSAAKPELDSKKANRALFPPVDLLGELIVPEYDAQEHTAYLQTVSALQSDQLPQPAVAEPADVPPIEPMDVVAEQTKPMSEVVTEMSTIGSISLDIRPTSGDLPVKKAAQTTEVYSTPVRAPITVSWHASRLEHNPLYFEDQTLERQGFEHGDILQPLVSGAKFFGTIPILPYLMAVDHPHECQSILGDRAVGTADCYRPDRLPRSLKGAVVEAGVVTGLIFFIP